MRIVYIGYCILYTYVSIVFVELAQLATTRCDIDDKQILDNTTNC